MELSVAEVAQLEQALADAVAYFEHRDRMNAMVHAPDIVRWSPITKRTISALSLIHSKMRGG